MAGCSQLRTVEGGGASWMEGGLHVVDEVAGVKREGPAAEAPRDWNKWGAIARTEEFDPRGVADVA
jgi:hypothetical protein